MKAAAMSVQVVAADSGHAAAIAAAHARLFDQPWDRQSIAGLLDRPGAIAFAAKMAGDSAIAGFIIGQVAADEAEILTAGVLPERQRRGVARQLVRELMAAAASRGAKRLYLEVAADNHPAIALYAGLGFDQAGRRKGYYARPLGAAPADALVMARSLSA
jgi:ribosomal-protein-alanine N-acetyltransferase